jgi:predicted aspartyl protease
MRTGYRVLAALVLAAATPARSACVMHREGVLPITLFQQKLFVPVSVNGTTAPFFLDTGAGVTTVSQTLAQAVNLPRNFDHTADAIGVGGMESHLYIAEVAHLRLGALEVVNRAIPIAAFAERLADGTPVGGLIGADILSRFDVEIDIPRRSLALWRVEGCSEVTPDWSAPFTAVPMQVLDSRHVTVPVRLDETRLDLLLDTGSPNLVLSTRAAARAGATPDILVVGRHLHGRGVNERPFDAWLHIFRRLEVAGQIFGDVRALVVNNGRLESNEGLLGLEYLKRGPVWLSYGTGTFFMQNGGGP